MTAMSNLATSDRTATRAEVLSSRVLLRRLAAGYGLSELRVDVAGTLIVHSEDPGYGAVGRFAGVAAETVGSWVNVITDDAPAAHVDTQEL